MEKDAELFLMKKQIKEAELDYNQLKELTLYLEHRKKKLLHKALNTMDLVEIEVIKAELERKLY